ncbi:hypothetical protein ABWW58_02375 [Sporolactobacillus sp. STCC-11]|uniref:hypothetical protein n=1 Tax=Sporolactobacillus caesalpiniae TaxID=3230362 RepID=UPI0033982FE3
MDKIEQISKAILDIRNMSLKKNGFELCLEKNLVIHGNRLIGFELLNYLKEQESISLDHEELVELIPGICEKLSLKIEKAYLAKDIDNPNRQMYDYHIRLV